MTINLFFFKKKVNLVQQVVDGVNILVEMEKSLEKKKKIDHLVRQVKSKAKWIGIDKERYRVDVGVGIGADIDEDDDENQCIVGWLIDGVT